MSEPKSRRSGPDAAAACAGCAFTLPELPCAFTLPELPSLGAEALGVPDSCLTGDDAGKEGLDGAAAAAKKGSLALVELAWLKKSSLEGGALGLLMLLKKSSCGAAAAADDDSVRGVD